MMTCKEASKIMSAGMRQGFAKRLQLGLHLLICGSCAAYECHMDALRRGIINLVKCRASGADEVRAMEEKALLSLKDLKNGKG